MVRELVSNELEKTDPENVESNKKMTDSARREHHSRPTLLSDFILGSQDGLVNVLGILLGLTAATADVRVFYIAALAALGAESISMGAVAYTSTSARRQVYRKEMNRERQEMNDVPETEKEEVRQVFRSWGYQGEELEKVTESIVKNPKAMLEFMMSNELDLSPVDKSAARRSLLIVGASTVLGSFIPLTPYLFVRADIFSGTLASVVFSGTALFFIGVYEAKTTMGSLFRSGLRMAAIGLAAGITGFLIGRIIGGLPL